MPKVIAPKGFHFVVRQNPYDSYSISIKLFKKNKEIGHVNLVREYKGTYSTHSYLEPKYHNKGLGALMYAKAIQWGMEHCYRVRSSGSSSDAAQRMWRGKKITKWFDIKVRRGKDYNGVIQPSYDTFYPKPKKGDKLAKKCHGNSRVSRQSRKSSRR